jgi:hypothetical protein
MQMKKVLTLLLLTALIATTAISVVSAREARDSSGRVSILDRNTITGGAATSTSAGGIATMDGHFDGFSVRENSGFGTTSTSTGGSVEIDTDTHFD